MNSAAPPVRHAPGDDLRRLVVRVVEDLHLEAVARPFDGADRIDYAFRDITLVVDGELHAYGGFCSSPLMMRWPEGPVGLSQCLHCEIQKVEPEDEEKDARHHQDGGRDQTYQFVSNRV